MARIKGSPKSNNAVGLKGRSGRKSKREEIAQIREQITSEALVALANSVVGRKLKALDEMKGIPTDCSVKDIAIPISLKGITENIKLSGGIKINEKPYGKALDYIRGRKASG